MHSINGMVEAIGIDVIVMRMKLAKDSSPMVKT
jgi:hypothetical protein